MSEPLKFKATIKAGVRVGQDFRGLAWRKPDMVFDVEECSFGLDCKAPGYGVINGHSEDYGNGSLSVYKLDDLVLDPSDRQRIFDKKRKQKLSQIDEKTQELNALVAELAALSEV